MQHERNKDVETEALTTKQAAQYLGLAVATLNKWRVYGHGPAFIKLGRAVRYRKSELDAYMASCARKSSNDKGGRHG